MTRKGTPAESGAMYGFRDARSAGEVIKELMDQGPGLEKLFRFDGGKWEQVYDDTYSMPGQASTVSFVGWNSSYTGEPIPQARTSFPASPRA